MLDYNDLDRTAHSRARIDADEDARDGMRSIADVIASILHAAGVPTETTSDPEGERNDRPQRPTAPAPPRRVLAGLPPPPVPPDCDVNEGSAGNVERPDLPAPWRGRGA